ncbi:MAG: transglutaminase [Candidatus Eiseniibacteriota bacterium]|nr:MAG: transglutaminase [Candidatus Eisenbacteria bacterium]
MKRLFPGILPAFSLALLFSLLLPGSACAYTGEVSEELAAPCSYATGLTWDGEFLWVCDWKEGRAFKVDPASGETVSFEELPCLRPQDIAFADGHLFICSGYEPFIYKLDLSSGTVVETFPTPESAPSALAWDGTHLWLADSGTDLLYKLNPVDGTTLEYFKAPAGQTEGLAWDGRYLWAADRTRDELYMLDSRDGTVLMVMKSPGPYPTGLVFDGKWLWNVDFQDDVLYRLSYDDGENVYVTEANNRQVTLVHQLTNMGPGTVTEASVFLALPEDSFPGQCLLESIVFEPEPARFDTDQWGQRVAVYEFKDLAPGDSREVSYTARARIGERRFCIFPHKVGRLEDIPSSVMKRYVADGSRYRISQPLIAETAKQVVGDEKNPYWMARKICQWVQDHVEYERVGGWDIAETLIKRGTGSCSEYSFLYIALCRAAGLPARFEGSVVVRGDDACIDDVFHRWCEVYLPGYGWIPVDPSGGDRPLPADQAKSFGMLGNRFFITTHGGGDSEYMGWNYNYNSRLAYKGKVEVVADAFALWEPLE